MKGSLSCWFFILTVLVLIMGGERSDEVRKGFVLNFKKKISLKHLVFRFQAINHCFRSKIPIVTDPFWANISKFGLFLQKMKFLFLANGEQQKQSGESGLQERRRVVKRSAFLSHLLPCFPGPLIESGIPSPWLLKGVHSSQRAGLSQVTRGALEQPYCRTGLIAEFWRRRQYILHVFAKNQKGGCLYKTKQKPLEPFKMLRTF